MLNTNKSGLSAQRGWSYWHMEEVRGRNIQTWACCTHWPSDKHKNLQVNPVSISCNWKQFPGAECLANSLLVASCSCLSSLRHPWAHGFYLLDYSPSMLNPVKWSCMYRGHKVSSYSVPWSWNIRTHSQYPARAPNQGRLHRKPLLTALINYDLSLLS